MCTSVVLVLELHGQVSRQIEEELASRVETSARFVHAETQPLVFVSVEVELERGLASDYKVSREVNADFATAVSRRKPRSVERHEVAAVVAE